MSRTQEVDYELKAIAKVDEALKKISTYWQLFIAEIIMLVATMVAAVVIVFTIPKAVPFTVIPMGLALGATIIFSLVCLSQVALRFNDAVELIRKHDCGEVKLFVDELKFLRNVSAASVALHFTFPPLLGWTLSEFIQKSRVLREDWEARFGIEETKK